MLQRALNFYSPSTLKLQLLNIASFATVQTGTVEIRIISSGKAVEVDGLGVSRS